MTSLPMSGTRFETKSNMDGWIGRHQIRIAKTWINKSRSTLSSILTILSSSLSYCVFVNWFHWMRCTHVDIFMLTRRFSLILCVRGLVPLDEMYPYRYIHVYSKLLSHTLCSLIGSTGWDVPISIFMFTRSFSLILCVRGLVPLDEMFPYRSSCFVWRLRRASISLGLWGHL